MKKLIIVGLFFICLKSLGQDTLSGYTTTVDSCGKSNLSLLYISDSTNNWHVYKWTPPKTFDWVFMNGDKSYVITFEAKDSEKIAKFLSRFFRKQGIKTKYSIR